MHHEHTELSISLVLIVIANCSNFHIYWIFWTVYYVRKVYQDADFGAGETAIDPMEEYYIDVLESHIVKYTNPSIAGKYAWYIVIF